MVFGCGCEMDGSPNFPFLVVKFPLSVWIIGIRIIGKYGQRRAVPKPFFHGTIIGTIQLPVITIYHHPAVTPAAGYFGPARVVFALLDGSDDGNISWDEFRELEKCPGTSWDGIMGRGNTGDAWQPSDLVIQANLIQPLPSSLTSRFDG